MLAPFLALGLTAHRALELVVARGWPRGEAWSSDYRQTWDAAADDIGVEQWDRLPEAPLTFVSFRGWLREWSGVTEQAHAEVPLSAVDGAVVGIADLVTRVDQQRHVLDLKVGQAARATADDAVGDQLHLYAALLEHQGGEEVAMVGLISGIGRHWLAPHDRERSGALLDRFRSAAQLASADAPPPGNVGGHCLGCRWLDGCPDAQDDLATAGQAVRIVASSQRRVGPSFLVEDLDDGSQRRVEPVVRVAAGIGQGSEARLVTVEDQFALLHARD